MKEKQTPTQCYFCKELVTKYRTTLCKPICNDCFHPLHYIKKYPVEHLDLLVKYVKLKKKHENKTKEKGVNKIWQ